MRRKYSGWSYGSQYPMPPRSELGAPKKAFSETFSAVTALMEEFKLTPSQSQPTPSKQEKM